MSRRAGLGGIMHLIDHFDRVARTHPARACIRFGGRSSSYSEVEAATWEAAAVLRAAGVKPGSRVAIYGANSAALFALILGVFRAGCVWIPINPLNGADENADILDLAGADAVVMDPAWDADGARMRMRLKRSVTFMETDGRLGIRHAGAGDPDDRRMDVIDRSPAALVSLHCTGGTTGRPKGVPFTNLMWEAMLATYAIVVPGSEHPVHLAAAPLSHGAGATALCAMCAGGTQVILPKFEAGAVLQSIEAERVTHLFLPPTAIYLLLAHPEARSRDLGSLRSLLYAAAPMAEERLREAIDVFGPVMLQTYGQTEAPLICTSFSPDEHVAALRDAPHRLRSCGRPTLLTEVRLLDDAGHEVSLGAEGEVAVRGNLVMDGYLAADGSLPAKRDSSAWHRTGDVGRFDADGYLYIVDRKKDMIISGGFNVYPSAVEQVLFTHPAVQDCAVIGVPDDKWGEAVKAVVELKPGMQADEPELRELCRNALGPIRTPKTVEFWPTLPRSPVGKVLKSAVRERYWRSKDRRI